MAKNSEENIDHIKNYKDLKAEAEKKLNDMEGKIKWIEKRLKALNLRKNELFKEEEEKEWERISYVEVLDIFKEEQELWTKKLSMLERNKLFLQFCPSRRELQRDLQRIESNYGEISESRFCTLMEYTANCSKSKVTAKVGFKITGPNLLLPYLWPLLFLGEV